MRLDRAMAIAGWIFVGALAAGDLVVGIPDDCGTVAPGPRPPISFGPTPHPWWPAAAVLAISVVGILVTITATRSGRRAGRVTALAGWVVAAVMGVGGIFIDDCGTAMPIPRPPLPFDPTPDPWLPAAVVLAIAVVGIVVTVVANRANRRA